MLRCRVATAADDSHTGIDQPDNLLAKKFWAFQIDRFTIHDLRQTGIGLDQYRQRCSFDKIAADSDHVLQTVPAVRANHRRPGGFVERFNRTVLDEFFREVFRKKLYLSVEELQVDSDQWLHHYNYELPRRGYRNVGKRPIETIDATEMYDGNYLSVIQIVTNDPVTAVVSIPTRLVVTGNPYLAIREQEPLVPSEFMLHQNYPNPFNPMSTIQFDLPSASHVYLVVYDLLGREVIRLVDEDRLPGYHEIVWHGKTTAGSNAPSGVYIARLVTPEFTRSIKMLFIK